MKDKIPKYEKAKFDYFFIFVRYFRLVRVPFYENEFNDERPDDRELEDIDPIYKIERKNIVKIKVGAPGIIEDLLYPEMR